MVSCICINSSSSEPAGSRFDKREVPETTEDVEDPTGSIPVEPLSRRDDGPLLDALDATEFTVFEPGDKTENESDSTGSKSAHPIGGEKYDSSLWSEDPLTTDESFLQDDFDGDSVTIVSLSEVEELDLGTPLE